MDLNSLGILFCNLAQEKGWGHTKETLVVSEKVILISTEITELKEARKNKNVLPKDTVASEYSDILCRTLHLGIVWGVDFNIKIHFRSKIKSTKIKSTKIKFDLLDLLYLHDLVATGYDYYRHKKINLFKKYLYIIAQETIKLSQTDCVDIIAASLNKLGIDKEREWYKKDLNGNYMK